MVAALVLLVLVAGFYACRRHPIYSYHLHRYEGQFLYLKSAEMGVRCVGAAFIISFLWGFLPDRYELGCYVIRLDVHTWLVSWAKSHLWVEAPLLSTTGTLTPTKPNRDSEIAQWTYTVGLSFLTLFVAWAWGRFAKLILWLKIGRSMTKSEGGSAWKRFWGWSSKAYAIGQLLKDSPIDKMLFDLSATDELAMLSMSDRKVYIGRISNLGEPSETGGVDQDILILPYMSGYRDKDRLTVEFTTHYNHVGQEISLSLRQTDIVSVTKFDAGAYEIWKDKHVSPEAKPLIVELRDLPPIQVQVNPAPTESPAVTIRRMIREMATRFSPWRK